MRRNVLFLICGLVASIISKILQFNGVAKLGNFIVLFSAVFFILAIAFSNEKFNCMYTSDSLKRKARKLLVESCITIIFFQLMMMLVVSKVLGGLILIIPIGYFGYKSIVGWNKVIFK